MTTVQIGRAGSSDTRVLADLLGEACHSLAPARWLVLNPTQRALILPAYLRIHLEHAMTFGEVHLTADRSAVAVWFHHDRPLPEPASYPTRLALACGQWADRFRALEAFLTSRHPPWPHHYLALLAVRPDRQGQGRASALLRHHHAHLDEHGIPAYLQACSQRARDLSQRHGYQLCGEPLTLPSSAPMWPMWRQPVPPATPPPHATESWLSQAGASATMQIR